MEEDGSPSQKSDRKEKMGGNRRLELEIFFPPLFKNKDEALIVRRSGPGRRVDCELVLKRALLAIPRVCRFIFSAFT